MAMHAPLKQPRRAGWPALLATAVATTLAACSGGDSAAPAAAPSAPASLSGSAAIGSADGRKGVLAGATACLDLDGNGACGSAEPQAQTGGDGRFVIGSAATAGLVVEVPASATADGVAVGRAFTLRAPAGSSAVTPLSTLVVAELDNVGGSAAEAAERLRQRGALAASPLAPLAEGDMARLAALVQRLGALQAEALAGSGLPEADIVRESQRAQAAALADLAQAARDAASDDTLRAIVARIGPDAAQVAAATRMFALAEPPTPATPEPGAQLTALRYTDRDNWFMRSLQFSADDLVVDPEGNTRYVDVYAQAVPTSTAYPKGVIQRWNGGGSPATAGTLHFNGTAWVTCGGLTGRYRSTVRDAAGRSSYDFCDSWETGNSIRRVEDISNQEMSAVVRDKVRTFPGGSSGVSYSSFGPSDLTLLDGRFFPEGSYLFYQQQTITGTAPSYDPRDSNRVLLFPAGVAAGGDTRSTPGLDCSNPTLTGVSAQVPAASLDEIVGRAGGRPCIYAGSGTPPDVSTDPNEWWSQSTVSVGTLAGFNTVPPGTGAFYNTTALLRVSFTPGGRARFHRCLARQVGGVNSARNCTLLGLGTWRIDTLGDARVLSFSTLPAIVQRTGFARVFVERGGAVYFGSKSPAGVVQPQVRMSLTAANALVDALPGMPAVRPITRPGTATGARAAALVTLQGAWGGADLAEATIFRFGANGRFLMAEAKPYLEFTQEQSGGELGWFDWDPANGRMSTLLEVDSNLTSGTSHGSDADPPLRISDTAIGSDDFTIPRLPDERGATPSSLVGLWAVNSPTDLSVAHLAFFANGRALFVSQQAEADCLGGTAPGECPPGVEYASYTWDPVSGTVVLTLLAGETTLPGGQRLLHYDTNGCQGLFDTCPTAVADGRETRTTTIVFTVAADGRTITFTGGDDLPYTLYRIATRGL
jgi:trimeric autotransporter adhesin